MDTRAVDGGARRWKAVQVGGGVAVLAGVLFALPNLHRPPPPSTALHRADIHAEYVKFPSGRDTITAYLAYPERKDPAPAVVVIHEIFGMSDFIRQTAEQLAKDGFVAIAPDLLSHHGGLGRRGRGDPDVPQDLPPHRLSRRRARLPADP